MVPMKVCPVCQKEFQPERNSQKLCSVPCRKTYQHCENHTGYKGGNVSPEGYRRQHSTDYEHREVAERALGKPLPKGAIVHHVDGNRLNNAPSNLVICQDASYHALLHHNKRIIDAGGKLGEHLFCGLCRRLLPLAAFTKHRNKPIRFDRSSWCKDCQHTKDRARSKGEKQ